MVLVLVLVLELVLVFLVLELVLVLLLHVLMDLHTIVGIILPTMLQPLLVMPLWFWLVLQV